MAERFDHPAFLYEGREDFLEFMVPYVTVGIDKGETVFVAARGEYLGPLSSEIGDSPLVTLEDTEQWHPHPASRLRAFHELLTEKLVSGGKRLRLAGEPVWEPGPPEYTYEWQRYESALNAVLGSFPVSLVCLYDASRLDPRILETAKHTHPTVHQDGMDDRSNVYETPQEFLRRWQIELSPPPPSAEELPEPSDLPAARRFLQERAKAAGVNAGDAADLAIATNELLTNALLHGGGARALRVWTDDGRFVCQVEDAGRGIADSLAGYRPPRSEGVGGRGLWVARQLVDLMQIDSGPSGTTVRLQVATG